MKNREKPIPEKKTKALKELSDLIKNKNTLLIASIKNLPAAQFQKIVKKLRETAIVKVPKKSITIRSLDSIKNEDIKKLKEDIKEDIALLFSDLDCFELAAELIESKTPAAAKIGQEAPEDIEIPAGPTELVPGPAISELGALGIPIQIEGGKIHVKAAKVIAKKGEKISEGAAGLMNKLGIKPFSVGFIPLVAFDIKQGSLYKDIKIDKQGTIEEIKNSFGRALPFAVEIGYVCEDTIKFLISKAGRNEKVLEGLLCKPEDTKNNEDEQETEKESNEKENTQQQNNGGNQ